MADPLFMNEHLLAKYLGITPQEWKKLAPEYERQGLPLIDPVCRLRYRPAVEAFFNRRYEPKPEPSTESPNVNVRALENLHAFDTTNRRRARP